jgi:uncharacterized membrane protein
MKHLNELSNRMLGKSYVELDGKTQSIAKHVLDRTVIARHPNVVHENISFGSKAADAVAKFGGSWTFIGLFCIVLVGWVILNVMILSKTNNVFDPYPFILLNLFLSMIAAIQAPIILMSQNRQSTKDRISAEHDYEVNLKAELEIMTLHEKIDLLREHQWSDLIKIQAEQLELLKLLAKNKQN